MHFCKGWCQGNGGAGWMGSDSILEGLGKTAGTAKDSSLANVYVRTIGMIRSK
jgi:hypothetical protein